MLPVPHPRGVLNIDKPSGPSSYDVIRLLKRRLKPIPERIGHAGTLDPMASGVLLVLLEEATRISSQLLSLPKEYEARILFGRATDTDDITGRTVRELPVPELTTADLKATLGRFVGTISQTPPKFSALKRDGRP
ncbi:MAG: tRNA pseudouridine(55) synthase, partial [candidate division WOR-3 bacterium]